MKRSWRKKVDAMHQFKEEGKKRKQKIDHSPFGAYSMKTLVKSFEQFDSDQNSYISVNDLVVLYRRLKIKVKRDVLQEIVNMLDSDGDGQIALDEFMNFTVDQTNGSSKHPYVKNEVSWLMKTQEIKMENPLSISDDEKLMEHTVGRRKSSIYMPTNEITVETISRARQYHLFEAKFVFESILNENDINEKRIEIALKKCLSQAKTLPNNHGNDFVEFEYLCQCLGITNKKSDSFELLEGLLDPKARYGIVPFRGVLLGLYIWICDDHEKSIDFAFRIFDRNESENIEFDELLEILFATNPAANSENDITKMMKKARFIMKQCDMDGNEIIDAEEFRLVATKFPNLVIPDLS